MITFKWKLTTISKYCVKHLGMASDTAHIDKINFGSIWQLCVVVKEIISRNLCVVEAQHPVESKEVVEQPAGVRRRLCTVEHHGMSALVGRARGAVHDAEAHCVARERPVRDDVVAAEEGELLGGEPRGAALSVVHPLTVLAKADVGELACPRFGCRPFALAVGVVAVVPAVSA